MMKYFKRSLKHNSSHTNSTNNHQSKTSTSHSDKHKCNSHYHKEEVNKITPDTYTPNHRATETDNMPDYSGVDSSDINTDSALDSE